MSETKDNSGALFRNEDKKEDKHPDYKGSALIEGREYWINAWINESKKTGKKYMKLSFKEKEQQQQAPPSVATGRAVAPEDVPANEPETDDVPF